MRNHTRIIILLTVLVLTLSVFGCRLVPNDNEQSGGADATGADATDAGATDAGATDAAPSSEPEAGIDGFDGDAIAIELGDVKIKANDIANAFDQYISMFTSYGSIDEETVSQCMSMVEDEMIRYYLPLWKANELGVTLSEAQEAEARKNAESDVDEERNALLCQFAYYAGTTDAIADDASELTEEQTAAAIELINEELADMFEAGFTFEDYLALELDNYLESYRIDTLSEELKNRTVSDSIDTDQINAWYETTLEAQKSKYASSPEEYFYDEQEFRSGLSTTPVLYVPGGYLRVQVIEARPDGEIDAAVTQNNSEMAALEAEYGALVLNNEGPARRKEIETDYAALKAENARIETAYYADAKRTIEKAYAALQNGSSFEEAMQTYNHPDESGSGTDERLLYVNDVDKRYGALSDYAKTLAAGAYSEPVLLDGAYVIVKVVEVLKEGPVDRAAIEDVITAAAGASVRDESWDEQFDAWLTEAKEIAVFHRETYDMLGSYYLN